MNDIVRVLRVIEYVGSRQNIELQMRLSLHGERQGVGDVIIKAATIGNYPEVLEQDQQQSGDKETGLGE